MNSMFIGAVNFNSDLAAWDVSKVTRMNAMFMHAKSAKTLAEVGDHPVNPTL